MSDQKLISPLLDGFLMGEPMSSHDGIRCCPAMRENSEEKYIVKIISVPASQKQLDALLLTGAYPDAAAATEYFKELADGIVSEAELLKQLSRLEGFVPYDSWQIVPMEGSRLGYEVYLLGPYRRSLEKFLRRNTMTHLGAVNLGLDLCAALSICRRAGFIHVDLRPENIFLTGQREYRIGDLGFVKLNSLKYASLPTRYRSCYTPPELHDALTTLNPTADIYAVGMILYQIYNNGVLPFADKAPDTVLPAPMNADYEMAEIILKACDPNPRKRWQTPIEMGQALVSYMQRNTINDIPIVPPSADPIVPSAEPDADVSENAPAGDPDDIQKAPLIDDTAADETIPDADNVDTLTDSEISDELTSILFQADALLSQQVPDSAAFEETEPAAEISEDQDTEEQEAVPEEPDLAAVLAQASAVSEDTAEEIDEPDISDLPRRKRHSWLTTIILILLLALLGGAGYYYYQNIYLLPIHNMEITPSEDSITVSLSTDIDDAVLSVICTDTYGNTLSQPVSGSKAVFTELNPGTMYKIEVTVEGFHALTGSYTSSFTTPEQTRILDFTAKTGTEDGSVILNFTVEGPEQDWIVEYTAEEEEPKSVSFTGHMVTINNLSVGKTYTFSLVAAPGSDLYIVGNDTLTFTASKIIVAENLRIVSCVDGVLTAQWNAPADAVVNSWTVRCYMENGYDETITTTEPTAQFSGIDPQNSYTVEVTADAMTQNTRAYVTANPITVSDVAVDASNPENLTISWNSSDASLDGGWLLMYAVDGNENYEVSECPESTAVISPRIPNAAYSFSIRAANGSTVLGGILDYKTPEADIFNDKSFDASRASASLCPTPEKADWTYKDIKDEDYTSTHASGEKVSIVIYSPKRPTASNNETDVMFVIRDAQGNVLSNLTSVSTFTWNDLWNNRDHYCGVNIPSLPTEAGTYTLEIYFDSFFVLRKTLNITE